MLLVLEELMLELLLLPIVENGKGGRVFAGNFVVFLLEPSFGVKNFSSPLKFRCFLAFYE